MGKKEGGRTLNPADKLRKEQKIKEAKKNAERRTATRAAIVAGKSEDDLRAQLDAILKAEKEGRMDPKQAQLKKQMQERLADMKKEEEEKPEKVLTLEEMYPDAEGSVYYHPIENPYGVPPPGSFQMWKPGYVPKAQRHLLPIYHPLHPQFKAPTLPSAFPGAPSGHTGAAPAAPPPAAPEDDFDPIEAAKLRLIPPPPEEIDSDGEANPPAPPTTEDDLPNIVYDDPEDLEGDEFGEEEGYFMLDEREDEMQPPPSKRFPPGPPPPFPMPPHGMGFPPMFPPPPFYPPGRGGPGSDPRGQRNRSEHAPRHGERRGDERHGGRSENDHKGPKKTKAAEAGEIPDPLDNGAYKKEGRQNAPPKPSTAPAPAPEPVAAAKTIPDSSATFGPMLVPSQLRGKRKVPGDSRPVAPRAALPSGPAPTAAPSAAPNASASASAGGASYDDFMSDMKNLGAIP